MLIATLTRQCSNCGLLINYYTNNYEQKNKAYDFLSGYECAQADYNRKRTNFMDIIETVMLCKGTRAALGFLGDFAECNYEKVFTIMCYDEE